MTSESTTGGSTEISGKMEGRRVIRDLRLKKNIVKNREKTKKKFSVKLAKCEYKSLLRRNKVHSVQDMWFLLIYNQGLHAYATLSLFVFGSFRHIL